MADGISIKARNSKELGQFLELWAKGISKPDPKLKEVFEVLAEESADLILEAIPVKLGGRYGRFMAERTDVEIVATSTGFRLNVFGFTEDELTDIRGIQGKSRDQDYNLWAMYEFGGGPGQVHASSGLNIQKDGGGGVGVVRTDSTGFTDKQGAIQNIVAGLVPTIQELLNQGLADYEQGRIAHEANKAAKASGLKGVAIKETPWGGRNVKTGQWAPLGNTIKKKLK